MSYLNMLAGVSLVVGAGIWLIAPRISWLSRFRVLGLYASALAMVLWFVADKSTSSAVLLRLGEYQITYSQVPSNHLAEYVNRITVADETGRRAEYVVDVDSERCNPLGFFEESENRWRLKCGDRIAGVYIRVEPLDVVGGDCAGTVCLRDGRLDEADPVTSDKPR